MLIDKVLPWIFLFQGWGIICKAQSDPEIAKSSIKIDMLFPEGKTKALILSYDDGPTADRRLVKLMNDYDLKGTFHLNSNKLGNKDYLTKAEIKTLFQGHEVSCHSANHPNLTTLSKLDIVFEIAEDRKALEKLTGYPVRGMAYPFGNYNETVMAAAKDVEIEYARTVEDSYKFGIPKNFLKWEPTIHQFGKAYFTTDNPENDRKEMAIFFKLIEDFLQSDTLALLDIWGHSWENDGAGNRWEETERFFKMLAHRKDIFYTTQMNLVDYINAFKNLKFSVQKNLVTNLSRIDLFIKVQNKPYKVPAGETVVLEE